MSNNLSTHPILSYEDVIRAAAGASLEDLVDVQHNDSTIIAKYAKYDMLPYTGERILVRQTLAQKLAIVQAALRRKGLGLKVVYGYRHPAVQAAYFTGRREKLAAESSLSGEALDRYTHNFVAMPDVAGHPTGGAVDLTLVDQHGSELDMGTAIADYTDPEKIKTFAPGLTVAQARARQTLHDVMVGQGFAPFYGEWWHFSYGDREWAAFYGKKRALYGAIDKKH